MRVISLILLTALSFQLKAQQKVSFYAEDSLKVTADLYLKDQELPFILLFHQGESSRGEFASIAERLLKLDYNCLAVDLRSGNKMNFITNETAQRAREGKINTAYIDALKDIEAAIKYTQKYNPLPVVLFGSGYSASLSLISGVGNPIVKAVVAFSPGEYFRPGVVVKDSIKGLKKPVFLASTKLETEYANQLISSVSEEYITRFSPQKTAGSHGAKTLWKDNPEADQCWLELMMFFKKLRF